VQLTSCVAQCRSPLSPKFQHVIGQSYAYDFDAKTSTSILGTSSDEAVLGVKGQAVLTFRAACDVVLQLRQTSISGLDDKVDSSELEQRPLLLSWQDGLVESICAHHDEPAWVVNIKRAVLSMLQHTSQFLDVSENNVVESDIIGRCPTSYEVESGSVAGQSVRLVKTKVPNQCSDRVERHSSIPMVEYNTAAEIQSMPLMNSTSVCKQSIKEGVVESAECRESHLFRPLSSENGGARTQVVSSLKLVTVSAAAAVKIAGEYETSSLIFDAADHFEPRKAKEVSSVVKALCQQLEGDSQASVAQLFTELVHSMRKASAKEIRGAYDNAKGMKVCRESEKTRQLFLDALPQAGNAGAISLMADILKEKKVSQRQALGWYLSLPLSKFVTVESIEAVLPLVDLAADSPIALLSISGLARRFCQQESVQCEKNAKIIELSNKLGGLLGNKCKSDDEVKVMSALKAIGNLGVVSADVLRNVNNCVKDDKLSVAIRLAAVEASRSYPCNKSVKEIMLNLLANKEEDNEVRIAAYLAIMRCPCSASLLRVQSILAEEEYNQVGSFIVSHLNNLKSNPTPDKEEARRLVNKLKIDRTFRVDLRKYSRNYANTHFCTVNNAGWEVDANVIYSTDSFLPRSASFNLTLDLFGQSVNLLQFGARMENVERILDAYLGPDGLVQKEGILSVLEKASGTIRKSSDKVHDQLSSSMRSKRAINNDLSPIDKAVDVKDLESGIKLDAYLRVFGSEVAMLNYRGAVGQKRLGLLDGMESRISQALKDLVVGAKKVDIDVARSVMFLDTAVIFPTVAGMPIKLAVNGTTAVAMGLESKMDVAALMRDPRNAELKLKISPLAVTELSAAMAVDMVVAKAGIKMVATVHTSAAADLSAKLVQGASFDVKIELPKSRVSVVEIKSELLLVQQKESGAERAKKLAIDNEANFSHGGCSERLSAFTGLRLCATSSLSTPRPKSDCSKDPAPVFPLSGSGSVSIVLEKTDAAMTGYTLSAVAKEEQGSKKRSLNIVIDTPGSTAARKISFKGVLSTESDVAAKMDAKTPWGSVGVESKIVNRADVKSLEMKLVHNADKEYFAKVQLDVSRSGDRVSYSPSVEFGSPSLARAVLLEGTFAYAPASSMEMTLRPRGPWADQPFGVQVVLKRESDSRSGRSSKISLVEDIATPLGKLSIKSEVAASGNLYTASVDMKYGTEKQHSLALNGQIEKRDVSDARAKSYKTAVVYKSSRFPVSNVDLVWDFVASPQMVSNNVVLAHGSEADKAVNRLAINHISSLKGKMAVDYRLENRLEVSYPRLSVDLKIHQLFEFDRKNVKAVALLSSAGLSLLDANIDVAYVPQNPKNFYEIEAKIVVPGRSIELRDVGKIVDDQTFSIAPVLDMQPGGKHRLSATANLLRDDSGLSLAIQSELRIEGLLNPIALRHTFQMTQDMIITTSNKLEWAGRAQLSVDGKAFLRVAVPKVEITALWNDRFEGHFETWLSRRDAKIDVNVNLLRLQRRVKVNGVYKVQGDNKLASFNAAWDADRDASKQVGLELALGLPKSARGIVSPSIKLVAVVLQSRYALSAVTKFSDDIANGETSMRVELELPSSSNKSSLSASLISVSNARKMSVAFDLDAVAPSGDVYHFGTINAVNDLKRETMAFTAVNEYVLNTPRTDEIKLRLDTRRAVQPAQRNTDIKLLISAPKWTSNIEGAINAEAKEGLMRATGQYKRGEMVINLESSAKTVTTGSKRVVEGAFEIRVPSTSWKQVKLSTVSSYDIAALNNFDVTEKMTVQFANSQIVLDSKMKVSPSSVDLSLTLETPWQVARRQSVNLSGHWDVDNRKADGSIDLSWSQNRAAHLELDVVQRADQVIFKIKSTSPIRGFESSELRFDGRSLNQGKRFESDLVAGLSGKQVKLSGHLDMDRRQRELDITLTLPSDNTARFFGRVVALSPDYSIESRIDWGSGSFLAKGDAKIVSLDDFEVSMKLDSKALDVNGYEVKMLNKLASQKRLMEASLKKASVDLMVVRSSYERKDSAKGGVEIRGKAELNIREPAMSSSLAYTAEKRVVDDGREYKLKIDLTAGDFSLNKVEANAKWTEREKSGAAKACSVGKSCVEGSFALKDASDSAATAYEGFTLLSLTEASKEDVQGLRFKYLSSAAKFEQTAELILDEKKQRLIGCKVYKEAGEYGIEVYTPKRKAAAAYEMVRGAKQQVKNVITVWLDKTSAADNKLVITNVVEAHRLADMDGYATTTWIKHPSLSRPLEYKLDFHTGKKYNLAHVRLDVDVSDSKHQRWILESTVRGQSVKNVTIETELRSKGAGVAAVLLVNGAVSEQYVSLSGNVKLHDKEGRVEKELLASLNATRQSAALTVGSPAKHVSLEGRWNLDDVVGHQRVQLSAVSHVFNLPPVVYMMDVSAAPSVDVRAFSKATPENNHHLSAGLVDDSHFQLALVKQSGAHKKDLAAVYVTLNTSELLHTRVAWKVEDIGALISLARSRAQALRTEVRAALEPLAGELKPLLAKWKTGDLARDDLAKIAADYAQQVQRVKESVSSDESLMELADLVRDVRDFLQSVEGILQEMGIRMPDLEALLDKIIESVKQSNEKVADWRDAAVEKLARRFEEMRRALKQWLADSVDADETLIKIRQIRHDIAVRVEHLVEALRLRVDSRWQELADLVKSSQLADGRIGQMIRKLVSVQGRDILRQRIAEMLEEELLAPAGQLLEQIAAQFPESQRMICRLAQSPLDKLRDYAREMKKPSQEVRPSPSYDLKSIVKKWAGEVIVFDPAHGEIQYQLPLYNKIASLRDLPNLLDLSSLSLKRLSAVDSTESSEYDTLADVYRRMRAKYDPTYMQSRVRGYAQLIGATGFVTFDNKFYQFAGSCQYLLARDFLEKDFALTVSYEDAAAKAVIFSDEDDQVEIKNKQVLINGKASALPAALKSIRVEMEDEVVVVKRSHGVVLRCHLAHDTCSLDISPFYTGRVKGMLGTFTHESADELQMPNGKISKDVASFAAAWKINRSCKDKFQAVPATLIAADKATKNVQMCRDLLQEDSSPLRSCFGVVAPQPYYELCVKSAEKVKKSDASKPAVATAAAYSAACKRVGVYGMSTPYIGA